MMRYLPILFLLFLSQSPAQIPTSSDLDGIHEVSAPVSKLSPPDRHEILRRLHIVASQLRGEAVHADGQESFVIQGYGPEHCGATGNCSFWVFDAQHNTLLTGAIAQQYRYLPQAHNGRSDVLTTMHGSAFESDLTVWRFDGHRYRRASCAEVEYAGLTGKVYKRPRITPAKCN